MNITVPSQFISAGPKWVARYLLASTSLGPFMDQPPIQRLLAEDEILASLSTWIFTIRPYECEELLLQDWAQRRPDTYKRALAKASAELMPFAPLEEGVGAFRLRIRLAACRKIDVCYCSPSGAGESFDLTPELGGEPYVAIPCTGLPNPIRIGRGHFAKYDPPPPAVEAQIASAMDDAELIQRIERIIAAHWPDHDTRECWLRVMDMHAAVDQIRYWETSKKVTCLNGSWWFDMEELPDGIVLRPPVMRLREADKSGNSLIILHSLGIAAFMPQVTLEFLKGREAQITTLMQRKDLAITRLASSDLVHGLIGRAA